jgi:hypothetical protein
MQLDIDVYLTEFWLYLWWSHSDVEPVISCMDCAEDNLLLVRGDRSAKCIIVRCATANYACAMYSCKSQVDKVSSYI